MAFLCDVLITVRGKPKARLIGLAPDGKADVSREERAAELAAGAEAARVGHPVTTRQEYGEEARSDRF